MKKLLFIIVCGLLSSVAWAQTPNFDYPYFVSAQTEGIIVGGNQVYDIPSFGDFDCDGMLDLMVGVFFNGNIWYYHNVSDGGPPMFEPHTVVMADGAPIAVTYG